MEPLGVQRRYVPHLKGLIYGKVEPKDEGCGNTITLCHAQLKKAILHLKTAIVWIFILPCVCLLNLHFLGDTFILGVRLFGSLEYSNSGISIDSFLASSLYDARCFW